MRLLEPRDAFVVAAEHEGRRGDQLEIVRLQRLTLVGAREKVVRSDPGAPRVGLAAPLELVDSVARAALHCSPNVSAAGSAFRAAT